MLASKPDTLGRKASWRGCSGFFATERPGETSLPTSGITIYQRFRRWERAGVFEEIFATTSGELDLRTVQVDGSYVKVHQHGAGAPRAGARRTNPGKRKPSGGVAAG